MDSQLRIGVDLGGTKIEAIALEHGRELLRRRVRTPREDYPATLRAIADLVLGREAAIPEALDPGRFGRVR